MNASDPQVRSETQVSKMFGFSVSINGNYAIVGAPAEVGSIPRGHGAAYVFHLENGAWVEKQRMEAVYPREYDQFGYSVSISENRIIVGAPWSGTKGSAHIFELTAGIWKRKRILSTFDFIGGLGIRVSIGGEVAAAGSIYDTLPNGYPLASVDSVYVFELKP